MQPPIHKEADPPIFTPYILEMAPLTEEERAAVKVQSLVRGRSGRADYALVRDEEACRQWITYYVALGEYEDAEELGWDGKDPPPPTKEELDENIAAMQLEEDPKAEPAEGASPSRGEQLYEEAMRTTLSDGQKQESEDSKKGSLLSPGWLSQIAQNATNAVASVGSALLSSTGSSIDRRDNQYMQGANQIRAAIVVQTWARVVLARAVVRSRRSKWSERQTWAAVVVAQPCA